MANLEKCVTRCETSAFTRILGHLVPIEKFTGMKFPTNSQILERYFFIRDHSSRIKKQREIANQIYDEVDTIYCKVPCVMKTKRFCLDQICSLYKKWDNLRRSEHTASEKSISSFLSELEKTCNLGGKNAIHEIKTDKCRDEKRRGCDIFRGPNQNKKRKVLDSRFNS